MQLIRLVVKVVSRLAIVVRLAAFITVERIVMHQPIVHDHAKQRPCRPQRSQHRDVHAEGQGVKAAKIARSHGRTINPLFN